MIEFGHATHTGLLRAHNEDTYWADVALGLFVVAGGIGGPGRGELASTTACRAAVAAVGRGRKVEAALTAAGDEVAACTRASTGPLGATLAILHLEGGRYTAASIGDAHLFGWRDGRLWQLPAVCAGDATAPLAHGAQPATTGAPHTSTQALGITPAAQWQVRLASGEPAPGMQFLLCSGGLVEALDRARLAAILARTQLAAQECIEHLILAALEAGGHDNLTAVLVRIH